MNITFKILITKEYQLQLKLIDLENKEIIELDKEKSNFKKFY